MTALLQRSKHHICKTSSVTVQPACSTRTLTFQSFTYVIFVTNNWHSIWCASYCLWNQLPVSSSSLYLLSTPYIHHSIFLCWFSLSSFIITSTKLFFRLWLKPICFTNPSYHRLFSSPRTDSINSKLVPFLLIYQFLFFSFCLFFCFWFSMVDNADYPSTF